ncbi:MAG TPA: FAD-binding protein [Myxococcota bacterium]|nr:FAD-binding protein [Myxococcota bacterium]
MAETASKPWDLEVDLVAVGSGLGAISAAIAAHDRGLRVAVLEKAPRLGGVSGFGGGEVFVPNNRPMRELGIEDSDEAGRRYFEFLSAGFADPKLQAALLENMKPAIEYMGKEAGVRWIAVEGLPDYYYPDAPGSHAGGRYLSVDLFDGKTLGEWQTRTYPMTPHVPPGALHREMYAWGGLACVTTWDYQLIGQRLADDQRSFGPGLMGWFVKAAMVDRGIPAFVGAPARALVSDAGAVIGVVAEREGREFRVRSRRGVVLGVGGYDHNRELARQFEAMPDWNSACPPYLHGDHLVMAGEVGAALAAVPPTDLAMFYGYRIPGEESDGQPLYRSSWECGCPHALWVNRAGERFCDESFYKDYQPRLRLWDGQRQTMPNLPPFLIFDQGYRDRYPLGSFMPGQPLPPELVAQAETPRELARQLGIDADGLERTLARFNEFARKGQDPDFRKGSRPWSVRLTGDQSYPNPCLGPVEKPPYYGIRLVPVSVGINSHGLRTNESAQVMHVRGRPIPGLYAVGNSAALLDMGGGYQSGTSNMRAITWGWIAGRHAAGSR